MFGEEHCYVIDAKAYGNCGRYLNVSVLASWLFCAKVTTYLLMAMILGGYRAKNVQKICAKVISICNRMGPRAIKD